MYIENLVPSPIGKFKHVPQRIKTDLDPGLFKPCRGTGQVSKRECSKGVSQELRKLLTCSECSAVLARELGISPGGWTHKNSICS